MFRRFLLIFVLVALAGCASRSAVLGRASEAGLAEATFAGTYFDLREYVRGNGPVVHIYIEGDGKAWRNRRTPSSDPTPDDPVALELALTDLHPAVAYLARPCQYVAGEQRRNCCFPLWTSARFAEPVVADMNLAIDDIKARTHAGRVALIGYSGGGAIALLVAARRNDVDIVVTVAGNLDHAFWTRLHGVSPLRDSLNPRDYAPALQSIRQVHIVSEDDAIVPGSVVQSYLGAMPDKGDVRVIAIKGVSHGGDWAAVVPGLLKQEGVW
ncbi:dienelactone hydrolase family protein [Pseudodesulfovibrio sp.]|uniref:dienelactone hydrolase family protein n=1 Tax=Pseudodesulfovibrio sp. TaxID=2035812 RepID=UPI0026168E8F|nr:dienelactone hydrolase family protein [Pseudodesulfovibrio sp.]MDD3313864.1 dienelactone hydrolase family protein [Pseudodesulfovibrio sp.]